MTISTKARAQTSTDKLVEDYLIEHPEFFIEHPEVLQELEIGHDSGGAASLIERQVAVLRSQNQQLRHQLEDLIGIARDNDRINGSIQKLAAGLLGTVSLMDLFARIRSGLMADFDADAVTVRLFTDAPDDCAAEAEEFAGRNGAERKLFTELYRAHKPVCGRLTPEQLGFLFSNEPVVIDSAAAIPLLGSNWSGLLAIGSTHATRFGPGMGTDLLAQLGVIVGLLLEPRLAG